MNQDSVSFCLFSSSLEERINYIHIKFAELEIKMREF